MALVVHAPALPCAGVALQGLEVPVVRAAGDVGTNGLPVQLQAQVLARGYVTCKRRRPVNLV